MIRCKKNIVATAMGFHYQRCSRAAIRDGYCWQHHPDAVKERQDESDRRYREKQKSDPYIQCFRMRDRLILYIGKLSRKGETTAEVIAALNAIVRGEER
jgi:hypothetical protein